MVLLDKKFLEFQALFFSLLNQTRVDENASTLTSLVTRIETKFGLKNPLVFVEYFKKKTEGMSLKQAMDFFRMLVTMVYKHLKLVKNKNKFKQPEYYVDFAPPLSVEDVLFIQKTLKGDSVD